MNSAPSTPLPGTAKKFTYKTIGDKTVQLNTPEGAAKVEVLNQSFRALKGQYDDDASSYGDDTNSSMSCAQDTFDPEGGVELLEPSVSETSLVKRVSNLSIADAVSDDEGTGDKAPDNQSTSGSAQSSGELIRMSDLLSFKIESFSDFQKAITYWRQFCNKTHSSLYHAMNTFRTLGVAQLRHCWTELMSSSCEQWEALDQRWFDRLSGGVEALQEAAFQNHADIIHALQNIIGHSLETAEKSTRVSDASSVNMNGASKTLDIAVKKLETKITQLEKLFPSGLVLKETPLCSSQPSTIPPQMNVVEKFPELIARKVMWDTGYLMIERGMPGGPRISVVNIDRKILAFDKELVAWILKTLPDEDLKAVDIHVKATLQKKFLEKELVFPDIPFTHKDYEYLCKVYLNHYKSVRDNFVLEYGMGLPQAPNSTCHIVCYNAVVNGLTKGTYKKHLSQEALSVIQEINNAQASS